LRLSFRAAVLLLAILACGIGAAQEATPAPDDVSGNGLFGIQGVHYVVVLLGLVLLTICVLVHYESLRILSRLLLRLRRVPRARIVLLIVGLIIVHQAEVWIWAWGYFGAARIPEVGELVGGTPGLLSYVYFSVVTYTTLGYGDIVPVGPIRFLPATEAIMGMVLVGWSAAFTFLEMQRFWKDQE